MLLSDHDDGMSNLLKRPFFQSGKHLALLCVVGALILLVATASFFQLKDQYNTRLQSDFQGRLGAVHQSLVTWSKERKSFMASWVNQPELVRISLPIVRNDNETSTKLARYNLDDFAESEDNKSLFYESQDKQGNRPIYITSFLDALDAKDFLKNEQTNPSEQ
mgnify:CR=1 FL=1